MGMQRGVAEGPSGIFRGDSKPVIRGIAGEFGVTWCLGDTLNPSTQISGSDVKRRVLLA